MYLIGEEKRYWLAEFYLELPARALEFIEQRSVVTKTD